MNKRYVLLLTGTIAPNLFKRQNDTAAVNVNLTDEKERLTQYESAITEYIKNSAFTDIVFAENSGAKFDDEKFKRLAEENGKAFEYILRTLSDEQIERMKRCGKSYGEADVIDYAIKNSRLISSADVIYKVTGRLFLRNSKKIVGKSTTAFIARNKIHWLDTQCFRLNKQDYLNYLSSADMLMDDYNCGNIEHVWCVLLEKSKAKVECFKSYPRLSGSVGSSGKNYDKPLWKYIAFDILCLTGYFKMKKPK